MGNFCAAVKSYTHFRDMLFQQSVYLKGFIIPCAGKGAAGEKNAVSSLGQAVI